MVRGRGPRLPGMVIVAHAVAIVVVVGTLAGCSVTERLPPGPWHGPPSVHTLSIQLAQGWSSQGGDVTITSEVTCDEGVKEVSARITRPDGSEDPTPVPMVLTTGDTYSGIYTAPANTRTDGQAETYGVSVRAVSTADTSGGMSRTDAFSVPAP